MIWAIFLLALGMVPCKDVSINCSDIAINTLNAFKDNKELAHEHSTDKHQDTCSPFCSCSCCGLSFTDLQFSIKTISDLILPVYFTKQFNPRSIDFLSSFHGNIWQPPKINA